MSIVIKILISTAMATVIGHKVFESTVKRNLRSYKHACQKKRILWCDIHKAHPALHKPHWRKIGKISNLFIIPVKSSLIAKRCKSVRFRDYGMCVKRCETYFWDGMFLVYNKTKGKFEDDRRYPLLQKMTATLVNTDNYDQMMIGIFETGNRIVFNLNQYPNCFTKETWNGTSEIFYSSNQDVNTWLKDTIRANEINEANEDVILTQTLPRNWHSTQEIKDNWLRFVEGYQSIEEDETGKFITLPRFILMTEKTSLVLDNMDDDFVANILIDTEEEPIGPFEEHTWDWIKIGSNVVLRNVKPVPSPSSVVPHYGIYCGLWSGGNVKNSDDVFISCLDVQHKCKANIV